MGNSSAKPGPGLRLLAPLVGVRLLLMHVLLMRSDWLACASPSWINYGIADCSETAAAAARQSSRAAAAAATVLAPLSD